MKQIIETLYPMNRCLLGEGYDNALEYLKHLLDFEVLEFESGTKVGSWTVPDEWIIRDAYVKYKGKKIIDFKEEPLSLMTYSEPINKEVDLEELKQHLHYREEDNLIPHKYSFYERDWGFCVSRDFIKDKIAEAKVEMVGEVEKFESKYKDKLKKGKYEVFIDSEFKKGKMKVAVHTIKGKSDREILLLAHLDHPYQANDNLSGVACLVDLATKIKCDHTVKIIICPETIGSIAYAETQDISKVDFVISVDICGNDNDILLQKAFNEQAKINKVAHCAFQIISKPYRKGRFRTTIGSDEYAFNDPLIGIDGLLLTTYPYKEYHTTIDKPDIIDYNKIKETQDVILKIIEIYEKDYTPKREFTSPLMRSKYDMFSASPQLNLNFDYFIYGIDGKKSLAELCADYELNFEYIYERFERIKKDGLVSDIS